MGRIAKEVAGRRDRRRDRGVIIINRIEPAAGKEKCRRVFAAPRRQKEFQHVVFIRARTGAQ
jgi:hypothetical protein